MEKPVAIDFFEPEPYSLWVDRVRLEDQLARERLERAIDRDFGPRLDVGGEDLDEIALLEAAYARWLGAGTSKYAGYVLHRTVVFIDPLVADMWVPSFLRRSGGSRARFSQGLKVLWRARERGALRGAAAEDALAALGESLDWEAATVSAPSRVGRRCEGRSRAPQGSAGGARAGSGGSRRGGDRGDDGGGGGSDGSGDGSSGSDGSRRPRRRINWSTVFGVCGMLSTLVGVLTFTVGPLHHQPTAPVAPAPVVREVIVKQAPAARRPEKFSRGVDFGAPRSSNSKSRRRRTR